jgi:hypothetical protein
VDITAFKEVPVPSPEQKTLRMHWAEHFNRWARRALLALRPLHCCWARFSARCGLLPPAAGQRRGG